MMDTNTLGVAVIGCGDLGSQHARAWAARDDARVLAVYDPMPERAERVATQYGARACASYEEAVAQAGVTAISVCTPVAQHGEVARCAAAHGRHILTEKAIALTVADAEATIAAAHEAGVWLSVSFQYRAFGRNVRLRELFQSGAFGGPVFVRYADVREVRPKLAMHRRSQNGGPVIDMAGHYFDLIRFLTGEEPQSVFASGHVFGRGKPRLAGLDDLAIDAASIQVRMGGGHVLDVFVDWGMPEGYPGWGEERFIGPALSARTVGGDVECVWPDRQERLSPPAPEPAGPTARIADLADAIRLSRPPTVSGEDGLAALRVSLAALESLETGQVCSLVSGPHAADGETA